LFLACFLIFPLQGLFHVEECGDDINNCEEQARTAACCRSHATNANLTSGLQRGPGGKDFMDDYDTAHKQPRPLRARGGPAHPTLAKSGFALPLARSAHVTRHLLTRARQLLRALCLAPKPRKWPRRRLVEEERTSWTTTTPPTTSLVLFALAPKPSKWPLRNPNMANKY
jgi:hypothetical protein